VWLGLLSAQALSTALVSLVAICQNISTALAFVVVVSLVRATYQNEDLINSTGDGLVRWI